MRPDRQSTISQQATRRLLPFLFLLYVVAMLDRASVGYAKLQMNPLPWMSEAVFGLGAGIFFVGYFIFEVPSNLILQRVGARLWIARIMMTWGVIAAAMMFANSVASFYGLRFLLGVAEAGFFPGIILYLTYWYSPLERAKIVGLLMLAVPVSGIVGGPLAGLLMLMDGKFGLHGWQWLFVLEGVPAVILGFVVLAYLPNGPKDAHWLTEEDRAQHAVEVEPDTSGGPSGQKVSSVVLPVVMMVLIYFCLNVAGYGTSFWLPQLISDFGKLSTLQVGLLTAIPSIAGAICMVIAGMHSDRTGERKYHVAASLSATSAGLCLTSQFTHVPTVALAGLCLANMGILATLGPFWAMVTTMLSRKGAAGGIALINSLGNLGGFAGPFAVGWVKIRTNSFQYPLLALAGTAFVGVLIALSLRHASISGGSQKSSSVANRS